MAVPQRLALADPNFVRYANLNKAASTASWWRILECWKKRRKFEFDEIVRIRYRCIEKAKEKPYRNCQSSTWQSGDSFYQICVFIHKHLQLIFSSTFDQRLLHIIGFCHRSHFWRLLHFTMYSIVFVCSSETYLRPLEPMCQINTKVHQHFEGFKTISVSSRSFLMDISYPIKPWARVGRQKLHKLDNCWTRSLT